ncbi:MAG: glycosyltransferase family 4 protein [Chloroflexi bacterium]|nr:MAG: glycosyltransferase family 4 protein [Chloroflexota bacterium]
MATTGRVDMARVYLSSPRATVRPMRIGLVSTRLAGVDGVSFEVAKWELMLNRLGHETRLCAGELAPERMDQRLIPQMHFTHPPAQAVSAAAFDPGADPDEVRAQVQRLATELIPTIGSWLDDEGIELLIVENAWAIPMQIPLGVALASLVGERQLPTIGHHHDYAWERERFATCIVPDLLDEAFPPDLPTVRHVSINGVAAADLERRRGITSAAIIPNAYDFDVPPAERDDYSRSMRAELGMGSHNRLFVQPTRVVPRKGIELAIQLVSRLGDPHAHLMITSPAGDEGMEYMAQLHMVADRLGVHHGPKRIYALSDAYLEADMITFPSLYEGFGNALVESVYFGKPLLVNRYSVYETDIRPLGFRFIEIEGAITDEVVDEVNALLADPDLRAANATHNFELGRQHLSYEMLESRLRGLLS